MSLWKRAKGKDFSFFDKTISEMFRMGSSEILVHKYLGPAATGTQLITSAAQVTTSDPLIFPATTLASGATVSSGYFAYGTNIPAGTTVVSATPTTVTLSSPTTALISANAAVGFSNDATKPAYPTPTSTSIQDILFLETRDRNYAPDVYVMRGSYQRQDNDFDLTQFGLFLQTGTVVMCFHHNDMVDILGRRIMNGDVLEFLHLKDDYAIDSDYALKRFYVVGDCSWATEGFSPTWYPHLWRAKLNPMTDSQEYKSILDSIVVVNNSGPMGTAGNVVSGANVNSTYGKFISINESIIDQAASDVPRSGYDVSKMYAPHVDENGNSATDVLTGDDQTDTADSELTADQGSYSPTPEMNPQGYLTGDGLAPDGLTVTQGTSFPAGANMGDYYLRLDYMPNRLFRFDGTKWVKMEDNVRTSLTPGDPNNQSWRNRFINDTNTTVTSTGDANVPERQYLNDALRPKKDY